VLEPLKVGVSLVIMAVEAAGLKTSGR